MVDSCRRTGRGRDDGELIARALSVITDVHLQGRVRELWESERTYREMVEHADNIILRIDGKGIIHFANDFARRFFGYAAEEILGKNVVGTIVPQSDSAGIDLREMIADIGRRPERYRLNENENMRRDGSRVWISWANTPFYDADGALIDILCVGQDITEKKLMAIALRQKSEELERYFDLSLDLLCIANTSGELLKVNAQWEKVLGYTQEELIGREFLELVHPEDISATLAEMGRLDQHKDSENFQNRYRCKDGGYRWIEWRSRAPNGDLVYAVARDITDRKLAEAVLRESEERFKALHNASFGGIFLHDQGVIFECNQGLAEMTGYGTDELIGMDGFLLVSPASRELVLEKIRSANQNPYEAIGLRKNGEEYPVRIEARIIPYKGRQVRSVEFRDLSESKRNEAEREKLQAQLVQAQKMESVGRLAGGIAHDFNNMLGVILGNVELAMLRVEPEHPLKANLQEIDKAARRSADLTRQLLAFARKQTVIPRVLDLNQTIEDGLIMLRRLIGEDVELHWLPGETGGLINIDPSQIDQILTNLCINARDAIGEHGRITIETGKAVLDQAYCAMHAGFIPGAFALLLVSDNGCGMDESTKAHLFEPFFTTKEIGKGTGLGLAMIYGIVKQNQGFINVYSEPGQGTTFRLYFPHHHATGATPARLDPAPLEAKGQGTILLVEDELMILAITSTMLCEFGYTVLPAASPGEALALARQHAGKIDLLMTDVVMPEMNGRDLAKSLLSFFPDLKRLFMSGYTANVIAHHGVLDLGVHFLQKPFTMNELSTKIREVLGRI